MSITWLHLSDLHRGQPGDSRWDIAREVVLDDLRDQVQKIGRPDLILFTGDLAYSGKRTDYDKVDETLSEILDCVGSQAALVTVPGNHDLSRPHENDLAASACKSYFTDEKVRTGLLSAHRSTIDFFSNLFSEYSSWWRRRVVAGSPLKYKEGLLPGDFLVSFEKDDLRLGIAGLNSAFLHFGAMGQGSLAIEHEQLARFSLSRWRAEHDAALLLMHHPRDWLHPDAVVRLRDAIYPANTFTACCFGHMHTQINETIVSGGTEVRRWLQAPSLFGLENYGKKLETRSVGYAWGRLERIGARQGALTHWPREARETTSGSLALFDGSIKPYPHVEEVPLRERRAMQACTVLLIAVVEEFPFVTNIVQRIEGLRPGLICFVVSADDENQKAENAELRIVLVGGLKGRGTSLVDHIENRENRLLLSSRLNAKILLRDDNDQKLLADLANRRGDVVWFETEDDVVSYVRQALDVVCKPPSVLAQSPVDEPAIAGGSLASYVLDDLLERRTEAKAKFAEGDFEAALAGYSEQLNKAETLHRTNPQVAEIASIWARCKLNVAVCHLALQDTERARGLLLEIVQVALPVDARAVLVRSLTNIREFEAANMAIGTLPIDMQSQLRELLHVSQGQIPSVEPESPDVLVYAAQLLIKEEKFHTAFQWTHKAIEHETSVLGKLALAETLMQLLESWAWAEQFHDPLTASDSEELLAHLERLLADLKGRTLAHALAKRVLEIDNGVAIRTDDPDRLLQNRRELSERHSTEIASDRRFEEAVEIGMAGGVAKALDLVADDKHAWRGRYRQIGILSVMGDYSSALEMSLRLVQDFPGRLNAEYEVARQLMRAGRAAEALQHARAAFDAVPGYGQRVLLADVELAVGEYAQSVSRTRVLADSGYASALELFALASEHVDVVTAINAWERYALQDEAKALDARVRIVGLLFQSGRVSEAADAAWRLLDRGDAGTLPAPFLYQFALLQTIGAPTAARERVARIAQYIRANPADEQSEALYLQLWSWLEAPRELPAPDIERLISIGTLREVSEAEVSDAVAEKNSQALVLGQAFQLGHIPFEAMVSELNWTAAGYAASIGDVFTIPAISVAQPETADQDGLDTKRLLVSDVALLLCAKWGLLGGLQDVSTEVLIFDDVRLRLMQDLSMRRMSSPEHRAVEADSLVVAATETNTLIVSEGISSEATIGEGIDRGHVMSWLRAEGSISRSRAETLGLLAVHNGWKPPEGLAIDFGSLAWFVRNELLIALVRTYNQPIRISRATVERIRLLRVEARRELEALKLCVAAATWLETQFASQRARIIRRPQVELPPAKNTGLEKGRAWVERALSWRVAAEQEDALCIVLDAFADDVFTGLYLPSTLHSIAWTKETTHDANSRFRPLAGRARGAGWIAKQLKLPASEREGLIRAGCADVADAETLAGLFLEYAGSSGLERIYEVIEAPLRVHAHGKALSAPLIVGRAYAATAKRLLGSGEPDSVGRFVGGALERLRNHGGRGVDGLLALLLAASIDQASSAYERLDSDQYVPSASSPVGKMLVSVIAWARTQKDDLARLERAAADTVALLASANHDGPASIALGVLQLFADLMPSAAPFDLSGDFVGALAIVGAIWPRSPLLTIAADIAGTEGDAEKVIELVYEDVVQEGARQLSSAEDMPELTPHWARWIRTVLGGKIMVTAPVEALLLRAEHSIASELAQELAHLQGPFDGVAYDLLSRLAATPSALEVRKLIAVRAIRSPWKRAVRDPRTVLEWGRMDAVGLGAPHRLEDVLALLSEPAQSGGARTALERLSGYLLEIWKDRTDARGLGLQATSVPGAAGYQAAIALASDPDLTEVRSVLESHLSSSFGQVWTHLAALWIAAREDRTRNGFAARTELQSVLPSIIRATLDDPERGKSEAALLRKCRNVLSSMHTPQVDIVWLTYRLFSWLWMQIRSRDASATRRVLDDLTLARTGASENIPARDTMDPASWREFPDLRLAAILSVVALGDGLPVNKENQSWLIPLSDELVAELLRVASRTISETDKQMRRFSESEWEWLGTAVPQENALHLLLRDFRNFQRLEPQVRVRWLCELPKSAGHGIQDKNVIGRLLIGAAGCAAELDDLEKDALVERLRSSTSAHMLEGPGQAFALIAMMREGRFASEFVWPRISEVVSVEEPGSNVARVYLEALVATRDGELRGRVEDLMGRLRGPSESDVFGRVQLDPIFSGQPELRGVLEGLRD